MTIGESGQSLSFSALRTEFVGGSSAISLSDLYRCGSNIRTKHPGNPAVNDAANIPTSGTIKFSEFYDQGKGFTYTYSANATDQDIAPLFGSDDFAVDYPKNVLIPSDYTIGTNNTSEFALELESGGNGTITITNNGTIVGAGGAAGSAGSAGSGGAGGAGAAGSAGGEAFKAAMACVFLNNGSLLAGGGGGGGGGGQAAASGSTGGAGGQTSITGSSETFAGGGGATGGTGGGGNQSSNATANTGGGGGRPSPSGSGGNAQGGNGAAGIVKIRYRIA